MNREIKFQIIHQNKVFGYERLKNGQWESMVPELNPDNGERWSKHVLTGECIRRQYTGLKDKNGVDIYEGDYLKRSECVKNFTGDKSKFSKPYEITKVIFNEGAFKLNRTSKSKRFMLNSAMITLFGLEVIGNIYSNPPHPSKE